MFCSISGTLWRGAPAKSRHEKCQDIATEIYKRINITFAIKELESKGSESELSDLIDSNELSNGTDLFAYDKTDSLSSSITLEEDRKIINLNNNEETLKKPMQRVARAKKRFRKRVKKKQQNVTADCSSDEEPLSRIFDENKKRHKVKLLMTGVEIVKDQNNAEKKFEQATLEERPTSPELEPPLLRAFYPDVAIVEKTSSSGQCTDAVAKSSSAQPTPIKELKSNDHKNIVKPSKTEDILDLSLCVKTSAAENTQPVKSSIDSREGEMLLNLSKNDGASNLMRRKRSKRKEERQECEHCKLSFSGIRGLRRHLKNRCVGRVMTAEGDQKVYACSECNYRGASQVSLRRHVGIHSRRTSEKKYACGECERRYTQRSTLRIHALTHRGERPHRCDTCHKSFTRYDTWKRHQLVHSRGYAAQHPAG